MTSINHPTSHSPETIPNLLKTMIFGILVALPGMANSATMTFDKMVGATDGSNLLGAAATQRTLYFKDVATENGQTVDAKITTTIKGDTNFADQTNPAAQNYFGDAGYIPNYRNSPGGPQDDLGFLYYGNGIDNAEDGITMHFEFFEGTGQMSGTFLTPLLLQSIELAVYDVDGEASQSEYFTAQKSDGLVSYATGTSPQALQVTDQGNSLLFNGPGTNFGEADATGAAILYYELTDALSLDFGSIQTSGPSQNAVFSAIDGDLSMFANAPFGDPVAVTPVPLPASAFLFFSSLCGIFAWFKTAQRKNGPRKNGKPRPLHSLTLA
ncbi:hypothetical protein [Algirhabdus cladophorae]|uniref:hypothetical protein n=1 Tax=Algirhabdus cladophorae TaxID=3377108 RepID=UPI003B84604C